MHEKIGRREGAEDGGRGVPKIVLEEIIKVSQNLIADFFELKLYILLFQKEFHLRSIWMISNSSVFVGTISRPTWSLRSNI